jgi:hypothetical protein
MQAALAPLRLPLLALALLAAASASAPSVAQHPQYEIAVSAVAVDPPAPAIGQRAMLVVTLRGRALTPASRAETVGLRVVFTRAARGDAPETAVGEQVGSMRLDEPITIAVPWIAGPGAHEFAAHAELLAGQRIEPGDVTMTAAPAVTVTIAGDARPAPGIVARPPGAAEPRAIREPAPDAAPRDRRIATAPLALIGARAAEAGNGLVLDVPVTVVNAGAVRAVEIRCSVFAQTLGDLLGTGQATRPVSGGTLAELVAVPISPRPGRSLARAARYSCSATFATDERPPMLPGGIAATAQRRATLERALGGPLVIYGDLAEGTIDAR